MSLIGNPLISTAYQTDTFSGDNSTVAYTLSLAPASHASIAVYISGLYQTPGSAYTITGTTITFTGAPPTGTNNIQVLHLGVRSSTLVPVPESLTPAMLNNANVIFWSMANTNVGIGNTAPRAPLTIGTGSGTLTTPLIQATGNANSFLQINAQNLSGGNNASTDLVLARNDGTDIDGYIDMGINSNTYAQPAYSIMSPNSGYLYVNGGDLSIGTQTAHNILFHTGNTTSSSERVRIDTSGNVKLVTSGAKILNSSGNPILQQSGSVVQTQYVSSGTRVSTSHSGSFAEPSSNYRVTITPTSASSMIILTFYVPLNQASASNILTVMRSFRSVGGTKAYNLTSAGSTLGSRNVIAGGVFRPTNGYDNNDMDMKSWTVIDFPGTTSAVSYGFETKPEGTNTTYWGYSQGDNGTWGWDSDIVIIAQEISQ